MDRDNQERIPGLAARPPPKSRARVLVVEDDPMSRRLLRDILRHRGHEVLEAVGVDDAREQLSAALDLVLLDLQIPGVEANCC